MRSVRVVHENSSYFQPEQAPEEVTLAPMKTAWFQIAYAACQNGNCPTSEQVSIAAPGTRRAFTFKESLEVQGGVTVLPVRSGLPK